MRTRSKEAWRTEWSRSVSEAVTCLKKNSGCDPWTLGESHPTGCPRDPSPAQPTGPALPPRPARAARRALLPTCPCSGRLLAAGRGWASCRGSPPPCPRRAGRRACHRSSPGWRNGMPKRSRCRGATDAEEEQKPRSNRCRRGADAVHDVAGGAGASSNAHHPMRTIQRAAPRQRGGNGGGGGDAAAQRQVLATESDAA